MEDAKIVKKIIVLISSLFSTGFLFLIVIVVAITAIFTESSSQSEGQSYVDTYNLDGIGAYSEGVEAYREDVVSACKKFNTRKKRLDLEQYVNAVLAVMMIESGTTPQALATDPMQASLCGYNTQYPKSWRLNEGITDPVYSIECGVQYFADACITAKVKSPNDFDRLAIAIQGYNFGVSEWVKWMDKKGYKYSIENATEYAKQCAGLDYGAKGTPSHGQKFLDTYKSALDKLANMDIGENVNVNTSKIEDILKLNEAQAWKIVTENQYSSKPEIGAVSSTTAGKWIVPLSISRWVWAESKGTKKKKGTCTVYVNRALKSFWASFFQDVFQDESKIVIAELGSWCFRPNTSGTSMSAHAFGTAVDINSSTQGNGYGQTPYTKKEWENLKKGRTKELTIYHDSPLVRIAKKYGLDWGGDWNTHKDGMHFSFCGDRSRDSR